MTKNGLRASDLITLTLIVACVVTAAIVGFLVPWDPSHSIPPAPITRAPSVTPSPFEVTRVFTNTPTQTAALPREETLTPTPTITPTLTATPTLSPTLQNTDTPTPTPTLGWLTPPGRNGTMPTTGASPVELFFLRALQPLNDIQFPFPLTEFLGYFAGGLVTYPTSKFIFEKMNEALVGFGKTKLTRAQKRFLAYPIAALIAVGATVLLHELRYAPLTLDALYKAFGVAFLTAQALHGYFDLTGADPAQESKNALVNLFAAVKGFQFAHVDAKVVEQGEVRERYFELLNAATEAERLLNAKGQPQ